MGSLGNTYEDHALDSMLGGDHSARFPATVYVALFTVACTDSTFGTEATGADCPRLAVTNDDTNWPDASGAQKSNGVDFEFDETTGDLGTVVAWAILDHATNATAANIIYHGDLAEDKDLPLGSTPVFAAGTLVVEAD